jgi:hypothetical protein
MKRKRVSSSLLAGAVVAGCVTGAVAGSGGGAAGSVVAAHARPAHLVRPSAHFLARARAALVTYLAGPDPTAKLIGPASPTAASSYNWSGYADTSSTAGAFSAVSGSWTTPAVKCGPEDQLTSEWVGLDGWTSNTVEQDGTMSWCFEGVPTYFTWYEMYPANTVEVGASLQPGDKVKASVKRSGTNYTLALTDSTNSANSFSESATCAASTCPDTSAEWIAERPAFSIGIAPLADYKSWKLSGGAVTANGTSGNISSFSPLEITMGDATGSYNLSTPSGLTKGAAFTTTWDNSY